MLEYTYFMKLYTAQLLYCPNSKARCSEDDINAPVLVIPHSNAQSSAPGLMLPPWSPSLSEYMTTARPLTLNNILILLIEKVSELVNKIVTEFVKFTKKQM